ncbi:cysteine peptidase family C39 domain-containing protein [Azospirillum doebereinerae]
MKSWHVWHRFRQVATPELRQGETAECGLAALAILLAHHGRSVSLETLRAEAGSTRLGVTARSLLQLARLHGMEARAFRKEPEGLADLGFPLIAHSRFIHFLVVEGMTARTVRVNDPACGPRIIPLEEFADDFTGVAITVRPSAPSLGRLRRPPTLWSHWLIRHQRAALVLFSLSLLTATAGTAAALGAGALADGKPDAAAVLAASVPVAVAAGWARERFLAALGERLADRAAAATLARLPRLPATWFARRSPGQIAAAAQAGGTIQAHIGAALCVAEFLPAFLVPVLAALAVDPWAAAGPVVAGLASLALLLAVHGRRGGVVARLGAGAPAPVLPDAGTLHAMEAHKTGGRDGELFGQLAGRHALHVAAAQEAAGGWAALSALRAGLAAAGLATALGLGMLGVAEGRLSAGEVVILAALAVALHPPLDRLDRRLPGRLPLRGAWWRLADAESAPTLDDASDGDLPRPAGRLVLEGAGFRASPLTPPVLIGIDLTVEPGRHIGIAGPSGAGKSVLAKLACGLLEPEPGRVRLDGHPVAAMARRFPGAVALVDRSSPVEPGTVADNLRFGDHGLTDAALREALALVGLAADLEPRGGLSLTLSRGGAELSGGQRRRLALARALLRKPALLVLDEALDALEPDLDRAIRDRLRGLGCTVLIVSRRPQSLAGCDHVIDLGAVASREAAP